MMMLRKKPDKPVNDAVDDIDEVIEGKRSYSLESKLSPRLYSEQYCRNLSGREVTYSYFQTHGFDKPIVVKQKNGLGVLVPDEYEFTVSDVQEHVGADCPIEVINSLTQSSEQWNMSKWVKYYNTPKEKRKKIWNVISLEFTGTTLDPLVQSPSVVREADWAQKAWPLDLMYIDIEQIASQEELTFPKVFKYCLMSVAGCYTDFHIDLGGTSVWYHILRGQKVFWLVPPTEDNLQAYEDWLMGGEQEHSFLADKCSGCQRVTLQAGDTFFIPTGWIHAVYTPVDSLVFGGNFLHSFNVGLQLRVAAMEDKFKVGSKYKYPYFQEMQWYVYDHYNIALTGKSFMSLDDKPVSELCEIVTPDPVLSKYELQGLRNLREWLPNQDNDLYPDELDKKQALLDSMMCALAKHSGDASKTPYPLKCSLLQWKKDILSSYKKQIKQKLKATTTTPSRKRKVSGTSTTSEKSEINRTTPTTKHTKHDSAQSKGSKISTPAESPKPSTPSGDNKTSTPVTGQKAPSSSSAQLGSAKFSSSANKKGKRQRCGTCKACIMTQDCKKCLYCKDKTKYGGKGTMKQSCLKRKCVLLKDNGMRYDAIHDPKQKKLFFTKTPRKIRSPQKLPKSPANVVVKSEPKSPVKEPETEPAERKERQITLTQMMPDSVRPSRSSTRIRTPNKRYIDDKDQSTKQTNNSPPHGKPVASKTPSSERKATDKADLSASETKTEKQQHTTPKNQTIETLAEKHHVITTPTEAEPAAKSCGTTPKNTPKKSSTDTPVHDSPARPTPAQIKKKTPQPTLKDKKTEEVKPADSKALLEFPTRAHPLSHVGPGRDISAEEFGYSLSHLESILSSAKSDKLSINSGDVIFYRTEPGKPGSEIRVFVKDKQQKIECEGDDNANQDKGALPIAGMPGVFIMDPKKKYELKTKTLALFLCLSQAVEDGSDDRFIYNGHVVTVVPDHYLLKQSQKCRNMVVVQRDDSSAKEEVVYLPLVYAKSSDLKICQHLDTKQVIGRMRIHAMTSPNRPVQNCGQPKIISIKVKGAESNQSGTLPPKVVNLTTTNSLAAGKGGKIAEATKQTPKPDGERNKNDVMSMSAHVRTQMSKESSGKVRVKTSIHADREIHMDGIKHILNVSQLGKYNVADVAINKENGKYVHTLQLFANKNETGDTEHEMAGNSMIEKDLDVRTSPIKVTRTYGATKHNTKADDSNQPSSAEQTSSIDLPLNEATNTRIINLSSDQLDGTMLVDMKTKAGQKLSLKTLTPLPDDPNPKVIYPYTPASDPRPDVVTPNIIPPLLPKASNMNISSQKNSSTQVSPDANNQENQDVKTFKLINNDGVVVFRLQADQTKQLELVTTEPSTQTQTSYTTSIITKPENLKDLNSVPVQSISEKSGTGGNMGTVPSSVAPRPIVIQNKGDSKKTIVDFFGMKTPAKKAKEPSDSTESKLNTPTLPATTTTPVNPQAARKSSLSNSAKRKSACGECTGCRAQNCRNCSFCKDMKKYGGPGKMKQKCTNRTCLRTFTARQRLTERNEGKVTDTSPTETKPRKKRRIDSSPSGDMRRKYAGKSYQDIIRAEYLNMKKVADCGSCSSCRIKKQLGGSQAKRRASMCAKKKGRINAVISQMRREESKVAAVLNDAANELDGVAGENIGSAFKKVGVASDKKGVANESTDDAHQISPTGRPCRKRKLTQKMSESLAQAQIIAGVASMKKEKLSQGVLDVSSELLDSYMSSQAEDESEDDENDGSRQLEEIKQVVKDVDNEELSHAVIMSSLMDDMEAMSKSLNSKVPPKDNGVDHIDKMIYADPGVLAKEEILLPVFRRLSPADLANCALVCKKWQEVVKEDFLWDDLILSKKTINEAMSVALSRLQPSRLMLTSCKTTAQMLQDLLSNLKACKELSLSGMYAIESLDLSTTPASLTSLDLSQISGMDDKTFQTLFSKKSYNKLQTLDLTNTNVGDSSLKLMASNLPQLQKLVITKCHHVTNEGIKSLSTQKDWPLQTLEMGSCEKIDDKVLNILFKCKGFQKLVDVEMNGCPMISQSDVRDFVKRFHTAAKEKPWKFCRRRLTRDL